jgi:hypothetical protein
MNGRRLWVLAAVFAVCWACRGDDAKQAGDAATMGLGDSGAGSDAAESPPGGDGGGSSGSGGSSGGSNVAQYPELWYSVVDLLVRISLDAADGNVAAIETYTLQGDFVAGQNAITMLDDDSLLLIRDKPNSPVYHITNLPRGKPGSVVTPRALGSIAGDLLIEGLYTDCDGRVYAMDSGEDVGSSKGNRLLRFTGDVLAGDLSFTVVSDLSMASVADIDDMGPAIVDNEIVDNPGLAIDTGTIYAFDYETGFGTQAGAGGSWGIHALGGSLFADGESRLYLLDSQARLYRQNPVTYEVSDVLTQGPENTGQFRGWSGLAGPLTSCETGFTVL